MARRKEATSGTVWRQDYIDRVRSTFTAPNLPITQSALSRIDASEEKKEEFLDRVKAAFLEYLVEKELACISLPVDVAERRLRTFLEKGREFEKAARALTREFPLEEVQKSAEHAGPDVIREMAADAVAVRVATHAEFAYKFPGDSSLALSSPVKDPSSARANFETKIQGELRLLLFAVEALLRSRRTKAEIYDTPEERRNGLFRKLARDAEEVGLPARGANSPVVYAALELFHPEDINSDREEKSRKRLSDLITKLLKQDA